MFSLILVLVGVLLVGVLAYIGIFYGGDSFREGRAEAEAAALIAQSAQIATASAAFQADRNGLKPQSLEDLVAGNYLSAIPPGWQDPADTTTPVASKVIESQNACELFNARHGIEGIPYCSDVGTPGGIAFNHPICCQ